jgi:hypothetical protein
MSLYSDPGYFTEHLTILSAPDEIPEYVQDLDPSFKNVINPENYNELENLR